MFLFRNLTATLALAGVAAIAWVLISDMASAQKTHRVEITGFKFKPKTVIASPGDKIVFINKDVVPHTATARGKRWKSGTLNATDSWTLTAGKHGVYQYFCRFHPGMTGRVVVK